MNSFHFSQIRADGDEQSSEEVQESIFPNHHEINITDGGEFLDDVIRIKDQPLKETNEKKTKNSLHRFVTGRFYN